MKYVCEVTYRNKEEFEQLMQELVVTIAVETARAILVMINREIGIVADKLVEPIAKGVLLGLTTSGLFDNFEQASRLTDVALEKTGIFREKAMEDGQDINWRDIWEKFYAGKINVREVP